MSTLADLHFAHQCASGKTITLNVYREADSKPNVTSNRAAVSLTMEEEQEYLRWRQQTVAKLMSVLTPGEVFACAKHGAEVLRRWSR